MYNIQITNTHMNAMCTVLYCAMPLIRAILLIPYIHSSTHFRSHFVTFGRSFILVFIVCVALLFLSCTFLSSVRQSWRSGKEFVRIKINIVHIRYFSILLLAFFLTHCVHCNSDMLVVVYVCMCCTYFTVFP